MNPLLQPEVQSYINIHELDEVEELLLSQKSIAGVAIREIVQQIIGRRKVKNKIPLFFQCQNIIFPPAINIEQSSSEATALFKAKLIAGDTLADLTGGFGVDSFFLSKKFREVIYLEPNKELMELASHNHRQLGASNIEHVHQSAEEFLKSFDKGFDACFIDPSRRDEQQRKVFRFQDCQPNVVALLPTLKKHFKTILIKAAPLLDITLALSELKNVSQVRIISIDNECKELLFKISEGKELTPTIHAIELDKSGEPLNEVAFTRVEENEASVSFSDPQSFLYEPSAALLKAGAFRLLCSRFGVKKLAPSTHLYTSNSLREDFPGKIFKITHMIKPDKREAANYITSGQANVTTRNYPMTPMALKKKLGLKDGGTQYVIGFSGEKKKWLVVAERIK
ncbi:MAG: hypothetical protein AB7O48_09330 [Cyclobacteriaceae bacterium]